MSTTPRRRSRILTVALVPLLGACSLVPPAGPAPVATDAAQPPTTVAPSDPGGRGTPLETGAPATSRTVTHEGDRFALDVFTLHRDGAAVTMNVRLRALDIAADTADHRGLLTRSGDDGAAAIGLPNGFSLIDTKAKMIYFPAQAGGDDLCSPVLPSFWVTGDEVWISCVFGAPPAETDEVTLRAASFGSFAHVPVQ